MAPPTEADLSSKKVVIADAATASSAVQQEVSESVGKLWEQPLYIITACGLTLMLYVF